MDRIERADAHPSMFAIGAFYAKSRLWQAKQGIANVLSIGPTLKKGEPRDFPFVLSESVSPLYTSSDPREQQLLLGKIQNLRLACRRIHRLAMQPGQTFSFWRQVGPPWSLRGYAFGREVRGGCVIPTPGGGLCQLSGSLLEAALDVDCDLIERHTHTALPADIPPNPRRDATVFWNYVDLRFRTRFPMMLDAFLTRDSLVVRVRGQAPRLPPSFSMDKGGLRMPDAKRPIESCYVCEQSECVRHHGGEAACEDTAEVARTAFLVDEYQPEYDSYVQQRVEEHDRLLTPFSFEPGKRSWSVRKFGSVRSFPAFQLQRSMLLRWAVARRRSIAKVRFETAESLARIYERSIGYESDHICISQTILPHVWNAGILGGRTFDVLMDRLPTCIIQEQLDAAAKIYPHSKTLVEFRAPRWFVEAEQEALQAARTIVTPHSQIAALFTASLKLDWEVHPSTLPPNDSKEQRDVIAFLGPTLARKGALAVREAARKLGFSLMVFGPDLEEPEFWKGVSINRERKPRIPWHRIHTVLQPALFEYWPRELLRAHAEGCRLVISPACGIPENHESGIYHVPFGDPELLVATLHTLSSHDADFHLV